VKSSYNRPLDIQKITMTCRFSGTFHTSQWYIAVDPDVVTSLDVKRSVENPFALPHQLPAQPIPYAMPDLRHTIRVFQGTLCPSKADESRSGLFCMEYGCVSAFITSHQSITIRNSRGRH
jgi:hypothetical protein